MVESVRNVFESCHCCRCCSLLGPLIILQSKWHFLFETSNAAKLTRACYYCCFWNILTARIGTDCRRANQHQKVCGSYHTCNRLPKNIQTILIALCLDHSRCKPFSASIDWAGSFWRVLVRHHPKDAILSCYCPSVLAVRFSRDEN